MATLIMTARLNDIDPQAWLADVLARIASSPQGGLNELLPWEWKIRGCYSPAHAPRKPLLPVVARQDLVGVDDVMTFTDFGIENLMA